ncbi:ArsI/CadI family heavy metal resistance metalloenzyme [Zavarzinella formosa]|uniref:ArsI/CadI family heavy metal resistance metalloenzyme n=1 Tax=Zavarzinella formosa TaxID=360055 RepID=UPI0002EBC302|nr:ArsI/CadI family heavy metal resistance metalloenzyme [Zavarzinella formosa]
MSDPVRFHLSLNVADLDKSVKYFRTLFGIEPAKVRADYAKFEPDEPPLVLSLEPAREIASGGALNHLGFRLPDAKALVAMQERLERAGLRTKREDGVECCYAKQTKFWANDPDGNLWEVYTFEGDLEHRGGGQSQEVVLGTSPAPKRVSWEHRMNEPVPARIPLSDGEVNEVLLRGTLNLPLSTAEQKAIIAEAVRVLKPGGRVFVHVLTGETPVDSPDLPGPAGAVRAVPFESQPANLLAEAGLVGVRMLKFDSKPCFVRGGVGMRELQLEGFRPVKSSGTSVEVMYKGPFRELRDDEGRIYPRGHRVSVPGEVADRFRSSEFSGQFTVFESQTNRPKAMTACGS